jgi:hypothetical protein
LHFVALEGLSDVLAEDPQPADTQASARAATPSNRDRAEKVNVRLDTHGWMGASDDDQSLRVAPREGP